MTLERQVKIVTGGGVAPVNSAAYHRFYPYHAELCALSELHKKPGFGVPMHSAMGGHSLLYLNGVRVDRAAGYPTLQLCESGESPSSHGAGVSVNSHYKNTNWVAAEGSDFLWRGTLQAGDRLTRAVYEQTQHYAKSIGVLEGVQFHDHLFRDKPRGMSERDYMYEISVATDYAACFGRDVYRARIPLDYQRMAAIVNFLNDLNTPYRDGRREYNWRLFNNNCAHVAHNALAAAGVWAPWPTGQFFAVAAFKFPVPKNEFVDLMLRANDLPIQNVQAMYEDDFVRRTLLETATLPTAPGALAIAERAIRDNEVYDTEKLRLIFYDNPFWGPYRPRFARIFREPRYNDLRANLRHFEALYTSALQRGRAAHVKRQGGLSGERARFQLCYEQYIAREATKVSRQLANLDHAPVRLEEPLS